VTTPHREQLVETVTDDGYALEGAVFTPANDGVARLPVVWMHGFTGRFYEHHALAIGRRLAERGHVFLTGNNRGHDFGAAIQRADGGESLRAGAWWESFDEHRFDFAAWIGFTIRLGFDRVILVGHSLGAVKAVHYMANSQDERIAALVSASGPAFLGRRIRDASDRLDLARRLVAEGRGRDLLPEDPGGRVTSAATYVDRASAEMDIYGLDRPNPPISRIRCPILFVLGSEEPEIATRAELPVLQRNASSAPATDSLYVEGADHVYRGREVAVADGIADWLNRLAIG
jgi:pimeloyl-ACP methyl ester carboxylesterase